MRHVRKIEKVLKLWRMRNLTLEGKITIFKTLAISKIIHLSLVTNVPTQIIKELNKIQKEFIWNGSNPKIKHSTLCNKYENGGLKMWIFYLKLSAYNAPGYKNHIIIHHIPGR